MGCGVVRNVSKRATCRHAIVQMWCHVARRHRLRVCSTSAGAMLPGWLAGQQSTIDGADRLSQSHHYGRETIFMFLFCLKKTPRRWQNPARPRRLAPRFASAR